MLQALTFLTPLGGARAARTPTPAAVGWFPAVGAVVGLAVGAVWWGASRVWPPLVAAGLAVAADLVLTGALHYDGLIDSADGLLPPMDRERRLEVMADPTAGAFGVATAIVVTVLRVAALAEGRPSAWLVGGVWCASRTVMALALRTLPYARSGGLAASFRGVGARPRLVGVLGIGTACGLAAASGLVPGVAAVAAVAAAGGAVLWLAVRRLGGYTGDVLGAAGVIGETAGLVAAAARW